MLHYIQNHNYSDYINMNDDSKNKHSNIESRYLQFLNERNKESINYRNNVNIYEENSKIIKSKKKILILKRARAFSKQNTFDKDLLKNINLKLNKNINENMNRNILNMKVINEKKKINFTIREHELLNKKEGLNDVIEINKKLKDDGKYLKFKKEIFEKDFQKLDVKVKMVKNINSKIIKMKTLSKKFFINKPIRVKSLFKNDKNNENINTENMKIVDNSKKDININEKNKTIESDKPHKKNLINFDKEIIINSDKNKTITYRFKEKSPDFEYEYSYFDISKIKFNSQIPKEYINIIYHNLLLEEDKGIIPCPNYDNILLQKDITDQMRSILIDWIIDVHYKFGFTDETLYMSVLIIDRYISYKPISKMKFQLLGITALLLSCKHEEISLPKIEDFIYITDNTYTKKEVCDMENDVLDVLNFELLHPSPIKFYEYMALKFDFDKKKFLLGKYLMESFMVDLNYVKYRASVIACSCVYIVMKYFKMDNYKGAYDKKYYNLNENDINNIKHKTDSDIKDCARDICIFIDEINRTNNYTSCKNKYSTNDNEKVSLIISGEIE